MDKITICGGGNGAQTLTAVASHNLRCQVDVYAPFRDEAERLRAGIESHGGIEVTGAVRGKGRPREVSDDPADVVPGSTMVVLVLPAFAHESTLRAIVPHLDDSAWVGAIPARGGFEYCAAEVLGKAGRPDVTVFGLQTLPWACRIQAYGRVVHVLGAKEIVDAASRPAGRLEHMAPMLEEMLDVPVGRARSMLALTLANTGQLIHPGIMYDLFATWNGQTFDDDHVPLFYQGLSPEGAQRLEALSQEIQSICSGLADYSFDLSTVHDLKTWLVRSYGDVIADRSTLHSAFVTNRAYASLRAPVHEVAPGRFEPAFGARYLAEDVPYGLAVSQGIARLARVETPVMDEVVDWARERLGDGAGEGSAHGRTPQVYGLHELDALIRFARGWTPAGSEYAST